MFVLRASSHPLRRRHHALWPWALVWPLTPLRIWCLRCCTSTLTGGWRRVRSSDTPGWRTETSCPSTPSTDRTHLTWSRWHTHTQTHTHMNQICPIITAPVAMEATRLHVCVCCLTDSRHKSSVWIKMNLCRRVWRRRISYITSLLVNPSSVHGWHMYPLSASPSPPGCDGRHLLRPEQERPAHPGAGGLLHSGPAARDEEDHLHRSVTFNPFSPPHSDLYLTSAGPSLPHFSSGGTDYWWTQEPLTPNRNTETATNSPRHPCTLSDSSDWISWRLISQL